ncbi:MAG: hypothetical protein ABIR63_06775 [Sphingomicrobium sp.]
MLLALASTLSLSACSSSDSSYTDAVETRSASFTYGSEEPEAESAEFDEDAARADAQQEADDDGYSGSCTVDCSGHDAGFEWAAEGHDDRGTSNSRSFDEGQEAYEEAVEERLEEKRQEFDDEGAESEYAE